MLTQFNSEFYKYKLQLGQRDKERWRWLQNVWKLLISKWTSWPLGTSVQYCRGFSELWRLFSTQEDVQYYRGYWHLISKCSVLWGIPSVLWKLFSTMGQYHQYYLDHQYYQFEDVQCCRGIQSKQPRQFWMYPSAVLILSPIVRISFPLTRLNISHSFSTLDMYYAAMY